MKQSKKKYEKKLIKNLNYFYPNSKKYFFSHGRSGFYFLLMNLKNQTKKRKIIINSLTLFEMVNMIIYAGFEPILADNNKGSLETNTIPLIKKNKNDVAAVIVTHLNGLNKDIFKVKNFISKFKKNKIFLIEDCAVSLGAKKNNKYTGNFGDFCILSFNIVKNVSSFTGGVLIDNSNNKHFINKKNYEIEKKWDLLKKIIFSLVLKLLNSKFIFPLFFLFIKIAIKLDFKFFLKKYRTDFEVSIKDKIPQSFLKLMNEVQCKTIYKQISELEEENKIRVQNSKYLYNKLKFSKKIIFPQKKFNSENIFIDFPVICKTKLIKKKIWEKSLKNFIDIKNYYYTDCQSQKIYAKYKIDKKYNSKRISENILMLPVNKKFSFKDLDRIHSLFQ